MGTLGSFCPKVRFTSGVVMCLRERILLFEEPDALVVLVRVCGGVGGAPAGTTRQDFQTPAARIFLPLIFLPNGLGGVVDRFAISDDAEVVPPKGMSTPKTDL